MPRKTINAILSDLIEQKYEPKTLIYADSGIGTVWVHVKEVTGTSFAGTNVDFPGRPHVMFHATRKDSEHTEVYTTLEHALQYLGFDYDTI